jgi:hypothetical protein
VLYAQDGVLGAGKRSRWARSGEIEAEIPPTNRVIFI